MRFLLEIADKPGMPARSLFLIFALLLSIEIGGIPLTSATAGPAPTSPVSTTREISGEDLTSAIDAAITKVPEFRFVAEAARRLGVRVWLFGGTAASFGHYTKWDLARSRGDHSFQAERFDYDYTNIFRSTQDLDIVIDGDAEQCEKLEAELAQKYPHFLGSKARWEVRGLRVARGEKEPILDNPNFSSQHTDSNSTGLIELTPPPAGQRRVRDARAWSDPNPPFLDDLRLGKLHYYFSASHAGTTRAKLGLNPPIFSVVRYLTKAFQYGLAIRREDLQRIQSIITNFDPARDLREPRAQDWLERNGKKLFMHAQDLDYAGRTLDELGLRERLIHLKSNPMEPDSLAWWLSRKPLPDRSLGTEGPTARELGLDIVAHETSSVLAYESITRSPRGYPNVFESSNDRAYERALHGEGFYTRIGTEGAANSSGITIRFKLNPEARLGKDFLRPTGDYVLILNRRAIEVIPESLDWTPAQFLTYLRENQQLKHSDRGLLEKLKRRMQSQLQTLDRRNLGVLRKAVREEFLKGPLERLNLSFLAEAFSISSLLPDPADLMTFVEQHQAALANHRDPRALTPPAALLSHLISQPLWLRGVASHPKAEDVLRSLLEVYKFGNEQLRLNLANAFLSRDELYGIFDAAEIRRTFLSESSTENYSEWSLHSYLEAFASALKRPELAGTKEAVALLARALTLNEIVPTSPLITEILRSDPWRGSRATLRLIEAHLKDEHTRARRARNMHLVLILYSLAPDDPKIGKILLDLAQEGVPEAPRPGDFLSATLQLLAPSARDSVDNTYTQRRMYALLELAQAAPASFPGAPVGIERLLRVISAMEPVLAENISRGTRYDVDGDPRGFDIDGIREQLTQICLRELTQELEKSPGPISASLEALLYRTAKFGDRTELVKLLNGPEGSRLPRPIVLRLFAETFVSDTLYKREGNVMLHKQYQQTQETLQSPESTLAYTQALKAMFADRRKAFAQMKLEQVPEFLPDHFQRLLDLPGLDQTPGFSVWMKLEVRRVRFEVNTHIKYPEVEALAQWANRSEKNLSGTAAHRRALLGVYREIFQLQKDVHEAWIREFSSPRGIWSPEAKERERKLRQSVADINRRLRGWEEAKGSCLTKAVKASVTN